MAKKDDGRISASKNSLTAAGTESGVGHAGGGSYTVTLDANPGYPAVEQLQTYTTKPQASTGYVPSPTEFDFMSSSLGSPTGTIGVVDRNVQHNGISCTLNVASVGHKFKFKFNEISSEAGQMASIPGYTIVSRNTFQYTMI